MSSDSATSRRRWFRFSLRTLLAIVSVASVACVAVSLVIREYDRRQREERARIQFQKTMNIWDAPGSVPAEIR